MSNILSDKYIGHLKGVNKGLQKSMTSAGFLSHYFFKPLFISDKESFVIAVNEVVGS